MKENLVETDLNYLWHPCTDINNLKHLSFPIIEKAKGVYLYEIDGRPLLDGIASWWCVNLGHGHPKLITAIQKQAETLQHAILGGMSHPNAIRLAERLAQITPGNLKHSFFASDGASAVEAALKISVQFWANSGEKGRRYFVGLEEGYHGDTIGAMGVGYVDAFHSDYKDIISPAFHALSPYCRQCPLKKDVRTCDIECYDSMDQILHKHNNEIAAVLVEPLCQAAAGVRIYPEEYLQRLRKTCDELKLILIADEIAVGFGRTGRMFACEQAAIVPDIMTIGKGITGGYMPLSVAITNDEIYGAFRNDQGGKDKTFNHSHTFGGNPIITGLALTAIQVYEEENILKKCRPRMIQLAKGVQNIGEILGNSKIQSLGMMGVIEISEHSGGARRATRISRRAYELGLFIRPRGNTIYLWPPLTTSEDELACMLSVLEESANQTEA